MLTSNKKYVIVKILIIFFIIINIFNIYSFALVKPTPDFYVNDYANLLNDETKDYIINTNKSLYAQTGAQIVVVTVPDLGGDSIEDYANELFREFGIGDKTKNNGLLLLLSLKERQFRVEVGYGLEEILPDAKTGRIQDEYIIPYFKENEWDEGIENGFNAFLEIIASEYNVNIEGQKYANVNNINTKNSKYFENNQNGEDEIQKNNQNIENEIQKIARISFISLFIGMVYGILNKKRVKRKILNIISFIYFIILIPISLFIVKNLTFIINNESKSVGIFVLVCFMELYNLIIFIAGIFIFSNKIVRRENFFQTEVQADILQEDIILEAVVLLEEVEVQGVSNIMEFK